MKDMLAYWETLQAEAAECILISNLAIDRTKRELFARLAVQLTLLASELECEVRARVKGCPN